MKFKNLVRVVATPRLRGSALFRLATKSGWQSYFWRNVLITLHSCDVSARAQIPRSLIVPHPIGIVIGDGAVIGVGVTIFQNVTLGRDRRGGYPHLEDGVCVMPGATIVGDVTVGRGAIIGANCFITEDVAAGQVVRAVFRHELSLIPSNRLRNDWPHQ